MSKTDKGAAGADQADKGAGAPDDAAGAPAPTAAPTKTELKLGETVLLTAVHGLLIHPFLKPEVRFDQGKFDKVVVDDWVKSQYEAGKLAS